MNCTTDFGILVPTNQTNQQIIFSNSVYVCVYTCTCMYVCVRVSVRTYAQKCIYVGVRALLCERNRRISFSTSVIVRECVTERELWSWESMWQRESRRQCACACACACACTCVYVCVCACTRARVCTRACMPGHSHRYKWCVKTYCVQWVGCTQLALSFFVRTTSKYRLSTLCVHM